MNTFIRFVLVILIAVYVISPIDLYPGMADDVVIAVIGILGNIALKQKSEK